MLLTRIGGPLSLNQKGYVQIRGTIALDGPRVRGRLPPHPWIEAKTKFQLHQVIAMHAASRPQEAGISEELRRSFLQYFEEKGVQGTPFFGYELSHLCHQKACTNPSHLYPESSGVNKSRNGCEITIKINGNFYPCCRHAPRCIASEEKLREALSYEVPPPSRPLTKKRSRNRWWLYNRLSKGKKIKH